MSQKEENTDYTPKCQEDIPTRKVTRQPSPYLTAGFISRITFWWVHGLFGLARKRPLENLDVHTVLPSENTKNCADRFESQWNRLSETQHRRHGSLFCYLAMHFKGRIALTLLLEAVAETIRFFQPILTAWLITGHHDETSPGTIYLYWFLLMLSTVTVSTLSTHVYFNYEIIAMGMRSICCSMIYRKVLMMSNRARRLNKTGHIVTLMSTAVETFPFAMDSLHALIFGPMWLVAFFSYQGSMIGASSIIGAVLICFSIFLQYWNGKAIGNQRLNQEKLTDKRVHLMSEIISAMNVIKAYCWEKTFATRANALRKSEMKVNQKRLTLIAIGFSVDFSLAPIVVFIMIATNFLMGRGVYPEGTLMIIGGLEGMSVLALFMMPYAIAMTFELLSTTERIKEFLLCEEFLQAPVVELDRPSEAELALVDVSARWDTSNSSEREDNQTLRKVTLIGSQGDLIGITGKVGSGKSSLLMAVLGELKLSKGTHLIKGRIAYVPQESWILSESVRNNIIMDLDYLEDKYNRIIKACALDLDLSELPKGDLTLVGERGQSLSGGQKARINLARAVYQDADIYLLDHPLAAVDDDVGKHIFNECICGLLRTKLRILVTHHLQYLPSVDKLLIMENGMAVTSQLDQIAEALKKYCSEPNGIKHMHTDNFIVDYPLQSFGNMVVGESSEENTEIYIRSPQAKQKLTGLEKAVKLSQKEKGNIAISVYTRYLAAGHGYILLPILLAILFTGHITSVVSAWYLSRWDTTISNASANFTNIQLSEETDDMSYIINVACTVLILIICMNLFAILMAHLMVKCSQQLYNSMFAVLLHVPIHFFETNPVGQILNRFSRDTGFMDIALFYPAFTLIQRFVIGVCYVSYACIISYWMLIGVVLFVLAMASVYIYTLPSIRDMKRIESSLRSPTYSHLSATLHGLPVIRAFRKQERFLSDAHAYLDDHTAAWSLYLSAQRFQTIAMSTFASAFAIGVITLAVYNQNQDVGPLGLSIIFMFDIHFHHVFQMLTETQTIMTSVERIQQFSRLEQEAPAHTDVSLPPEWPRHGQIQLRDMCLTYRAWDRPALGPISVIIKAGEKVGVVGRTGAGKSSLFVALLRMEEPTGSIQIDGVEVTTIGLTDLRSRISVIPQDPVLFSGSLRYNLDPFDEYGDNQLWTALRQVQLYDKVVGLAGGLSQDMGEGGANFSVGERQLLCLARALQQKNKILIVDEATANVDARTDAIIQKTLSMEFNDATVLTIAHRLETIITYDKIMVLDQGNLVEYGHPADLLADTTGKFTTMVQRQGEAMAAHLKHMATRPQSRCSLSVTSDSSSVGSADHLQAGEVCQLQSEGIGQCNKAYVA